MKRVTAVTHSGNVAVMGVVNTAVKDESTGRVAALISDLERKLDRVDAAYTRAQNLCGAA